MDKKIEFKTVPTCIDFNKDCPKGNYLNLMMGGIDTKICRHQTGVIVCGLCKEKRKPDKDGTLPMTREEMTAFGKAFRGYDDTETIRLDSCSGNIVAVRMPNFQRRIISNAKAIIYLAGLFDLMEENK